MPKRKVDVELLERLYKHRMKAVDLLEELESILGEKLPAQAEDKLLELYGHLRFSCPLHPDAKHDDFDENRGRGCLICLSHMRPDSEVLTEKRHDLAQDMATRTNSERAIILDGDTSFDPWGSTPELPAAEPELVPAPEPPPPAPSKPKVKVPPPPSKPLVLSKPSVPPPAPVRKPEPTIGAKVMPNGTIRYGSNSVVAMDDPIVKDVRKRVCEKCWKEKKDDRKYQFMGRFNSPKGAECSLCGKHMMIGAMVKELPQKKTEVSPP